MKTKSLYLIALSFVMGLVLITSSCGSEKKEVTKITLLEKRIVDNEDTTDGFPKFLGDVHGGKYYSHTDSAYMYGSGTSFNIHDSLVHKALIVKVNMWVRQNALGGENQFAIALQEGDSILTWEALWMQKYVKEANKWTNIQDSIVFHEDLIKKPGLRIKVYTFNPKGKPSLDADDVELMYSKMEKFLVD